MHKKMTITLLVFLLLSSIVHNALPQAFASKATQYRVYQNNTPLKEFTTLNQAKDYATYYEYSHIEKISNKEWVWDNLPKYKVYVNGKSNDKLDFPTLQAATAYAKTQTNSYVRALDSTGWVYENIVKYELYQADNRVENGRFTTLDAAKKEASKLTNAHIIDLNSQQWIWDNISNETRAALKKGTKKYDVYSQANTSAAIGSFAFLKEAIMALNKLDSGSIYNSETDTIVFSTEPTFEVFSQGKLEATFTSLQASVEHAKTLYLAEVRQGERLFWSNSPYLAVYQNNKLIKHFFSLKSAIQYAKGFENTSITFGTTRTIWSNIEDFIFLGWNGSSGVATIEKHIANTQGLDVDSPTWYYLEDESGKINDSSNAELVRQYAALGIDIIPLVHNQFDPKMTSAFFNDDQAQHLFITSLISSLKAINVKGFNLDFEEISAKDRDKFTAFVKNIATAAHKENLTISIDFLRGDVRWNNRTAYDREAIAPYVDYVIIMGYDQHWKGSETTGSVAGLKWTEEGIQQYLEYGIPRNKIILGIPFYVREWRIDVKGKLVDNKAILMKDIDAIIKDNKATVVYDEQYGQNKVTYQKDGYTHVFWAETVETVKARVELAKKYDLAGIAVWRLGYEQPEVWESIIKLKTKQ